MHKHKLGPVAFCPHAPQSVCEGLSAFAVTKEKQHTFIQMSRLAGESGRGLEVSSTGSSAAALVGVHSHLMLFPDQAAVAFAVKDLTDFFFF